MPFESEAQMRFMFAKHPEIARRWVREFGPYRQHSDASSESEESQKPGVKRLPRKPGVKRDFAMLKPSASARMKPASRARPSLLEDGDVETGVLYQPGSRHSELGRPKEHPGLRGRDVRKAAAAIALRGS